MRFKFYKVLFTFVCILSHLPSSQSADLLLTIGIAAAKEELNNRLSTVKEKIIEDLPTLNTLEATSESQAFFVETVNSCLPKLFQQEESLRDIFGLDYKPLKEGDLYSIKRVTLPNSSTALTAIKQDLHDELKETLYRQKLSAGPSKSFTVTSKLDQKTMQEIAVACMITQAIKYYIEEVLFLNAKTRTTENPSPMLGIISHAKRPSPLAADINYKDYQDTWGPLFDDYLLFKSCFLSLVSYLLETHNIKEPHHKIVSFKKAPKIQALQDFEQLLLRKELSEEAFIKTDRRIKQMAYERVARKALYYQGAVHLLTEQVSFSISPPMFTLMPFEINSPSLGHKTRIQKIPAASVPLPKQEDTRNLDDLVSFIEGGRSGKSQGNKPKGSQQQQGTRGKAKSKSAAESRKQEKESNSTLTLATLPLSTPAPLPEADGTAVIILSPQVVDTPKVAEEETFDDTPWLTSKKKSRKKKPQALLQPSMLGHTEERPIIKHASTPTQPEKPSFKNEDFPLLPSAVIPTRERIQPLSIVEQETPIEKLGYPVDAVLALAPLQKQREVIESVKEVSDQLNPSPTETNHATPSLTATPELPNSPTLSQPTGQEPGAQGITYAAEDQAAIDLHYKLKGVLESYSPASSLDSSDLTTRLSYITQYFNGYLYAQDQFDLMRVSRQLVNGRIHYIRKVCLPTKHDTYHRQLQFIRHQSTLSRNGNFNPHNLYVEEVALGERFNQNQEPLLMELNVLLEWQSWFRQGRHR